MFSAFLNRIIGFKDVITFTDIGDEEIDYVQNFMKTKALKFISQNKKLIDYYGVFFSDTPADFEFTLGERHQIKQASKHVRAMIQGKGIEYALQHFFPNENKQNNRTCNCDSAKSGGSYFFAKLLQTGQKNASRKPGGYRYDDDVKLFATYLRMLAGPLAYGTLSKNLKSFLPSLSATNKYIQKSNCRIIEGILRSNELLQYLVERNLPLVVSLSEDATKITNRIQYDPVLNQMVGFVLQTSKENGMPIPFSYRARNVNEIVKPFANDTPVASNVNVVMAQPLDKTAPAFCLLLFSSDNKYNSKDVENRWNFIVEELKNVGIRAFSFTSDSDQKYNSAMRRLSSLGIKSNYFPDVNWFHCGVRDISEMCTFFVQDTPHIGSKLRNFYLKAVRNPTKYPFGKYFISLQHLQYLLDNFTKDKHNLTPSIVYPYDRQNFEDSVLRICDKKVTDLMRSSVIGSQATIKFLEMMKAIIDSYDDVELTPIERVEKIWYCVFIIRIWREYILRSKQLNLKENFLTANCYSCIELNAHSLVLILLHLQQMNAPELFIPNLLNSQPCERIFRQVRSFTSTYSTMANCSVKEILERISKFQMQSDIIQNLSNLFEFPHLGKSKQNVNISHPLPTLPQIQSQIEICKKNALQDAVLLGLLTKRQTHNFDDSCKVISLQIPHKQNHPKKADAKSPNIWDYNNLKFLRTIQLKNYAKNFAGEKIEETSSYVELFSDENIRIVVKKSSLCWLLRKDYTRISSDRLVRVQMSTSKKHKKNIIHEKKNRVLYKPIGRQKRILNRQKKNKILHYCRSIPSEIRKI